MKTHLAIRLFFCCIAPAVGQVLVATSHAGIVVIGGTVTETFSAQPPATSWSTTAVGTPFGGGSGGITDNATADTRIATVNLGFVSSQLTLGDAAGAIALQNVSRYYTNGFIGTAPTVVDGNLALVTLTNGTGINLASLAVRYDLGIQNGDVLTSEEIAGHRVYWSLTGNADSWNPIGNFGFQGAVGNPATQTQTVNFNVPFSTWAAGTDAYILWLDDNAVTNPDGLYSLDNVTFTAVPEPSACLLAIGALGVIGTKLRRKGRRQVTD